MARGFKSTAAGIVAGFDAGEIGLLRELLADVAELLENDVAAPESATTSDPLWALTGMVPDSVGVHDSEDAVVQRLIPTVASSDAEESAEYRRLTEQSLVSAKLGHLKSSIEILERTPLVISTDEAVVLSKSLNSARLALAERLDIKDEKDAESIYMMVDYSDASTDRDQMALVYNFVSWVQESLMNALLKRM
ncbi:DUF2017 family protein [Neomicrococcus aestuarii]|uniref:Uncharacterized protein n=1 Tax=Neomicrococcus aestuarii TaxID=556325 RepID=A0A1L2ZLI8_9MICC|nr:DUF2017 family protein [Neomicrococcus aestuarii]APF39882.1 hypothetical protein BHE16_01310 [Neomicrococcus aestuarii]